VIEVDPSLAPNDLDIPIVITGTGFTAGLSGTLVITPPAVYLGDTALGEVTWVSSTTLHAVVPWGLDPAVYPLEVENPDGGSGSLTNAFTVTQGIGVWNAGELYGGSIDEIVIKPITPTTLYASSSGIGLFRSRDGGESWTFQFSGLGVGNVAIDPVDPNYIYMFGPWQLYRSDDGGDSWSTLETEFPVQSDPPDVTDFGCGADIRPYPHPTESGTVFASLCHCDHFGSGLLRSVDYGQKWEPAMEGITDTYITDLAFHPDDSGQMVVGTANGNVFVSSNGATTWTFASNPVEYVHVLAFNPFAPYELWVSGERVVKSADESYTTWVDVPPPADDSWPGEDRSQFDPRFIPLHFSPNVTGTVYTIIMDRGYKSLNGGSNWSSLGPDSVHFPLALAELPGGSDTVYMGDLFSAFYTTTDGGDTWELSNTGISAAVPESLAVSRSRPDMVYGTMQDTPGIYRGSHGGDVWQFLDQPERRFGATAADPFTPDRVFAGGVETGVRATQVCWSDDGGESWPACAELPIPSEHEDCPAYVETLRTSPLEEGMLLAGLRHWCGDWHAAPGTIYYSIDAGDTWTRAQVTSPISVVQDLAFDPVSPTFAYAGAANGFFRSTDSGQTWERMEEGPGDVGTIAMEPAYPYRILTMDAGDGGMHLIMSSDRGETWDTLPWDYNLGINVGQLLFAPTDPPVLYAASPTGLLRSPDGGETWSRAAGELGHINIRSLAVVTTTDRVILYAATPGGDLGSIEGQALAAADASGTLVSAGVYRYTMQNSQKIYLPLVLRAYTP